MRHEQDDGVAGEGETIKKDEGTAKSPAIDHQPAGVGVDGAEEGAEGVEGADDKDGCA